MNLEEKKNELILRESVLSEEIKDLDKQNRQIKKALREAVKEHESLEGKIALLDSMILEESVT
jgi:hypothetical protein